MVDDRSQAPLENTECILVVLDLCWCTCLDPVIEGRLVAKVWVGIIRSEIPIRTARRNARRRCMKINEGALPDRVSPKVFGRHPELEEFGPVLRTFDYADEDFIEALVLRRALEEAALAVQYHRIEHQMPTQRQDWADFRIDRIGIHMPRCTDLIRLCLPESDQ